MGFDFGKKCILLGKFEDLWFSEVCLKHCGREIHIHAPRPFHLNFVPLTAPFDPQEVQRNKVKQVEQKMGFGQNNSDLIFILKGKKPRINRLIFMLWLCTTKIAITLLALFLEKIYTVHCILQQEQEEQLHNTSKTSVTVAWNHFSTLFQVQILTLPQKKKKVGNWVFLRRLPRISLHKIVPNTSLFSSLAAA